MIHPVTVNADAPASPPWNGALSAGNSTTCLVLTSAPKSNDAEAGGLPGGTSIEIEQLMITADGAVVAEVPVFATRCGPTSSTVKSSATRGCGVDANDARVSARRCWLVHSSGSSCWWLLLLQIRDCECSAVVKNWYARVGRLVLRCTVHIQGRLEAGICQSRCGFPNPRTRTATHVLRSPATERKGRINFNVDEGISSHRPVQLKLPLTPSFDCRGHRRCGKAYANHESQHCFLILSAKILIGMK